MLMSDVEPLIHLHSELHRDKPLNKSAPTPEAFPERDKAHPVADPSGSRVTNGPLVARLLVTVQLGDATCVSASSDAGLTAKAECIEIQRRQASARAPNACLLRLIGSRRRSSYARETARLVIRKEGLHPKTCVARL
jgi:hypothetical protein